MNSYSCARYYDSHSGRFISEDPARWDGSFTNFYTYVASSPIDYRDPSGQYVVYNGDVGNYAQALAYLRRNVAMAKVVDYLSRAPVYIEIIETDAPCGTRYSGYTENNKIWWNPHCAYQCEQGPNSNTPACVLGHELIHAYHNLTLGFRARWTLGTTDAGKYNNLEELYTIAGPENNFEIEMGECVRPSHGIGTAHVVPKPTDKY